MEETANLNVSIPITGVLNDEKEKTILSKYADDAVAERFLQSSGIKASTPLLRQTKRLLKHTMGEPRLKQYYVNDEYYATVDYDREEDILLTSYLENGEAENSLAPNITVEERTLKPVLRPSVFKLIHDEDKIEKPIVSRPIAPLLKEIEAVRDSAGGKFSRFLLQSQANEEVIEQQTANQLEYEQVNVQDEILMQRFEFEVDASYTGAWCVGGISECEIARRFLERYTTVATQPKPKAPFNEERASVLKTAKAVNKYKVFVIEELLYENQYTFFPIVFNDVFPDRFCEILRLYGIEDGASVSQHFKMRVMLKYKDDEQRGEVEQMVFEIRERLNQRFGEEVDVLITKIVEAGNISLTSEAGAVLSEYYASNLSHRVPTSVNGVDYVSCKMDERMQQDVSLADCIRYIEGFCTAFEFKHVDCACVASRVICEEVAQLSLAMARIFEQFFIKPIHELSNEQVDTMRRSYIENTQQTAAAKTIATLQDFHTDQQDVGLQSFFEQFAQELETEEKQRMQSEPELIPALRRQFHVVRDTMFGAGLETQAGAQKFVNYLVKSGVSEQISPQRFRMLRTEYLKSTTTESPESRKTLDDNAKYLQYQILAALVAAVKAVEEMFPLIVNSKLGEIEERRFKTEVWKVCDENGVLLKGLRDMYLKQ